MSLVVFSETVSFFEARHHRAWSNHDAQCGAVPQRTLHLDTAVMGLDDRFYHVQPQAPPCSWLCARLLIFLEAVIVMLGRDTGRLTDTVNTAQSAADAALHASTLPRELNLMAFATIFANTCVRRLQSPTAETKRDFLLRRKRPESTQKFVNLRHATESN